MSLEEQAFRAYRSHPTQDRLLALLRTQQDRVYNLCYQVLRHAQDAEDAAQKVLLKLVQGLGALPDATSLRRWLYRVCVTTALDSRTERERRRAREREVALMKKTEWAPRGEGEADLVAAIGSLETDLGGLLLRHFFEKATLKELAAEERVSETAVWKRIEKGKEKLRERLTSSGAAMSMAVLDLRLASIVPMSAPAVLTAAVLGAKAGAGVAGGVAVAITSGSTTKIVAACVGLLAVGLGAGLYVQTARAREESAKAEEHALQADARRRRGDPVTLPSLPPTPAASASAGPESAGPAAASGAANDSVRERMRKVVRIALKAKGLDKNGRDLGPEVLKEIEAFQAELAPVLKSPMSDPAAFARYLRMSLEVMFEEFGDPMSDSQKTALADSALRMRGILEESRKEPVRERTIAVLKGYRELIDGMRPLSESQLRRLAEYIGPSELFPANEGDIAVLNGVDDPTAEVLRVWTRRYPMGNAQRTIAATAARTFVEAWDRIDRQYEAQYGKRPGGRPEDAPVAGFLEKASAVLNYVISTQEAQRDALRLLEGGLEPEQLTTLRELPIIQFQRAIVSTGPAGKDR